MRFTRLDAALLSMVVIWGANFSVIKYALREFDPITFNVLRLLIASAAFLAGIVMLERGDPPLARADWLRIAVLGIVGHLLYQLAFLEGLARTTVGNSALIFGATPVVVAFLSSIAGHERVRPAHWVGAALSVVGIYAIVGHRATLGSGTLIGDALVFAGMLCWSIYSVLSQPLLRRHSPLVVTGYSMTLGAALLLVVGAPSLGATEWRSISTTSWVLMTASALLALAFAYMVWYTAVQQIGSSRTAIYSNLTPIVAMIVAAIWLGESLALPQVIGTGAILGGVFVTRLESS